MVVPHDRLFDGGHFFAAVVSVVGLPGEDVSVVLAELAESSFVRVMVLFVVRAFASHSVEVQGLLSGGLLCRASGFFWKLRRARLCLGACWRSRLVSQELLELVQPARQVADHHVVVVEVLGPQTR